MIGEVPRERQLRMCGIFGIIGHNARVPAEVLERATQSLAHRGPDDSGTVILRDSRGKPSKSVWGIDASPSSIYLRKGISP